MDKNENPMTECDQITKQHINDGVVEHVRSAKTSYGIGSVHYLRHCAVVCQNRDTSKVRIVFDALKYVNNEPSRFIFKTVYITFTTSLRKKCPNTEFFLVRIQENPDQKKFRIWTLHAVHEF